MFDNLLYTFHFCLHSSSFCQWSPLWWHTYWKNAVIYFLCRPFSFLLYKSFQTPSGDKNIRNRILSSYLLTFKEQKNGIITCLRVLWYILNVSFCIAYVLDDCIHPITHHVWESNMNILDVQLWTRLFFSLHRRPVLSC